MEKFKIPNINEETSVTKTIRIKKNLLEKIDEVADKNNISTNRLIIECINYALENMEDTNKDKVTN